jgi:hypothetical protein
MVKGLANVQRPSHIAASRSSGNFFDAVHRSRSGMLGIQTFLGSRLTFYVLYGIHEERECVSILLIDYLVRLTHT